MIVSKHVAVFLQITIGGCSPSYIQIDVHSTFSCLEMNTVFDFSCFLAKLNNLRIVVLLSGEKLVSSLQSTSE